MQERQLTHYLLRTKERNVLQGVQKPTFLILCTELFYSVQQNKYKVTNQQIYKPT
jgi:hypothetical protein